jgi:hypothetical protein
MGGGREELVNFLRGDIPLTRSSSYLTLPLLV